MNKYKLLFWIWLGIILTVSSIPGISTPKISSLRFDLEIRLDYVFHLLEYLLLVFFFYKWKPDLKLSKILLAVVLFIVIAAVDEFHQMIIPGRVFNPNDLFYNVAGIMFGSVVTVLSIKRKQISRS